MPKNEQHPRLSRGQFGRLSQLSRKALRLYDERGLLVPSFVDTANGYRYYQRDQLAVARRISLMRLMDMPLDQLAKILSVWDQDSQAAQQLIDKHLLSVERHLAEAHLAARLLREEIHPQEEINMDFEFGQLEFGRRQMISIRRNITVPAYHEWNQGALQQLWRHVEVSGGKVSAEPVALYYGPVNEEDDGPVEIGVIFEGSVPPEGEMKIREWPAHRAVSVRTFGEYNEYPKLLEMWSAIGRYVDEQGLDPNWANDLTMYEIWHADHSMTICWPVMGFPASAGATVKA